MKSRNNFFIAVVGLSLFASCESDCLEITIQEEKQQTAVCENIDPTDVVADGVVYPKSVVNAPQSRVNYTGLDWEHSDKVKLPSGENVDYPWVSGGNLPDYMKEKLTSDAGWELIAHTMYPDEQNNRAFLIFHNYVTGMLRVYCYVSQFATNNNGFWKVSFNQPNKLLNFANSIAIPMDTSDGSIDIIVSNHGATPERGFGFGWNGFEIELAYDPNATGKMTIVAYNTNQSSIELDGTYDGVTDGVIITQTKSDNLITQGLKGLGTVVGNLAGTWINKNKSSIKIPFVSSDSLGKLAKDGIGAAFNSFSGLFKSNSTQTSDVHLTTHGTIDVAGFKLTHTVAPIEGVDIDLNLIDGKLGAWNLASHPTAYWYKMGHYEPRPGGVDDNYTDVIYRTNGIERVAYEVIVNPKAQNLIKELMDYDYVTGAPNPTYTFTNRGDLLDSGGAPGGSITSSEVLYDDGENRTVACFDLYLRANVRKQSDGSMPPYYVDFSGNDLILGVGKVGLSSSDYKIRMYQDFSYSINGGPTYNYYGTKTFMCRHEWGSYGD